MTQREEEKRKEAKRDTANNSMLALITLYSGTIWGIP